MLRVDLEIIRDWIKPGSSVLDLGCGDGCLLDNLARNRKVKGVGLEIDIDNVALCIKRGVNVIHADLDKGLSDYFKHRHFDYVVMTQTLQAIHRPAKLLNEMLDIGKEGIITFPNMGYWRSRCQLFFRGAMPMTRALPANWFNTKNIHLCTIQDFENLCHNSNIRILERVAVDHAHRRGVGTRINPNLIGEIAIYRISRH